VSFYPDKIDALFRAPQRAGAKPARANAAGTGASFTCGTFARFFLEIDAATKLISDARYRTSGCGFAVAAAEALAEKIVGRKLTELHGLDDAEFFGELESALGAFPAERKHCAEICFDALEEAFREFRASQIEEFAGEKALICTCFGVSEDTIRAIISERQAATVEEVGELSHAGTGCGACSLLIEELIDLREMESL